MPQDKTFQVLLGAGLILMLFGVLGFGFMALGAMVLP